MASREFHGSGERPRFHFAHNSRSLFAFGIQPAQPIAERKLAFIQFDADINTPLLHQFEGEHLATDGIISPDEKHIITRNTDRTAPPEVTIWDTGTRKEIKTLKVAPKRLYDMALSPRGTLLATAGDDGAVHFWDMKKLQELVTPNRYFHEGIDYVKFSPDGKYLVTYGTVEFDRTKPFPENYHGILKVWDAPEAARSPSSEPPLHTEVLADGTIRYTYADGYISYYKPPQEEKPPAAGK